MTGIDRQAQGQACAPTGLIGQLAPEVSTGLAALARVARALTGTGELADVAEHALGELREAFALDTAVLYVPEDGRVLRRFVQSPTPQERRGTACELELDPAAWRLAIASGFPLVFGEEGSWLLDNPFDPPPACWLVLPLVAGGRLAGVAMAARAEPLRLDATTATVLSLVSGQLAAGIATAQLRGQLQRAAIDQERLRLAAQLHDGLAQDLALGVRELALLDSGPRREVADASRARLRGALEEALALVRARLADLSSEPPVEGLRAAVEQTCGRFAALGLPVRAHVAAQLPDVPPPAAAVVERVLTEALANAHRHAAATAVDVRLAAGERWLELVVDDDGRGFDPEAAAGRAERHFGLSIMRDRARDAGAGVVLDSAPGRGTRVALVVPLEPAP